MSYARLHQQLQALIAQGPKIADATAKTPAAKIHEWINKAEHCLSLLEDKVPTALSGFKRLREDFEFKLNDDEENDSSGSAYRPQWTHWSTGESFVADVLLDFKFEYLGQANNILKLAATKLELEDHSVPSHLEETLGVRLRAARLRAGHTQREAANAIGYDHKNISEWETGKRTPHPMHAKNICDYILKHPENG